MNNKYTFTIDWEDFSQLLAKYKFSEVREPLKDIDRQNKIILDLLAQYNIKGTFFILGILAKYRPDLVKDIQKQGHEIAIHGYYHENLNTISYTKIKEDITLSKNLVEDIIGERVHGYRAPFFSLTQNRLPTLDILAELDLLYDSSIMPADISKYGIAQFDTSNTVYKLKNTKEIVELPVTTFPIFNKEIPISGGSYMRILPISFLKACFKKLNLSDKDVMLYMHPYEFDSEKIDISANFPSNHIYPKYKTNLQNLRWNIFRNSIIPKIDYLLKNNEFATCLEMAVITKKESVVKLLTY
jgi:polysaccharide deacetylase family protein (PEP-CTERM system associated)